MDSDRSRSCASATSSSVQTANLSRSLSSATAGRKTSTRSAPETASSAQRVSTRSSPKTGGKRHKTSDPVGTPPSCACGCGGKPKWNPRLKRWGRSIFGHARSREQTAYARWKKHARKREPGDQAPPCLCGCEKPVKLHPFGSGHFWADFLQNHQMRGRTGIHTASWLRRAASRMRRQNPMFDPKVARRACSTRMLASSPTKVELRFSRWTKKHCLPVSFRGTGKLWVNRRNPDFRVLSQKKVIEITTCGIFNGGAVEKRTARGYGRLAVLHYTKSKWQCLVIFCHQDHRRALPTALLPVVRDFCSQVSSWSGVWNYDRLIRFNASSAASASTTSPARRSKPTKPTA